MKIKIQNTLTILSIGLFLISFNANSEEMSKEIVACNDAVNKGDATAAIKLSEVILEQNETDHEGFLCKGRALSLQGKTKEALESFEKALSATKETFVHTVTYILMGNLHQKNNKTAEAVNSYKKSLAICAKEGNQTYSRINYNLIGDTYTKAGDLNAALDHYKLSVSIANNDNERGDSYQRLAKTYSALGDHNKAIEYQIKTVVMQKKAGTLTEYADASLTLGEYLVKVKNYSEAERTYAKLAKFGKDNGGAYYEARANFHLAETKAANGDKAMAKTLMTDSLSLANKIGAKGLASDIAASRKKLDL